MKIIIASTINLIVGLVVGVVVCWHFLGTGLMKQAASYPAYILLENVETRIYLDELLEGRRHPKLDERKAAFNKERIIDFSKLIEKRQPLMSEWDSKHADEILKMVAEHGS